MRNMAAEAAEREADAVERLAAELAELAAELAAQARDSASWGVAGSLGAAREALLDAVRVARSAAAAGRR